MKCVRGLTACVAGKRHVIDAVVTVNVTEHQSLEIPICMLHQQSLLK